MEGRTGVFRSSGAAPIYAQLIMHFRQQIQDGAWPLGATIAPLHELAVRYGVTRATVQQAVSFLQREGLLRSRRGRGTEVTGVPRANLWRQIPSDWQDLVNEGDTIVGDVLELARPMRLPEFPPSARGELAPDYHVVRRRLSREGIPYLVGTSYIDQRIVAETGAEALRRGVLYRVLQSTAQFRAQRGEQRVTIGTADAEVASLLEIPLESAIVTVLRWVYDRRGTLIYHSEGLFRSDFVQVHRRLR